MQEDMVCNVQILGLEKSDLMVKTEKKSKQGRRG